jgi:hypothetical protein
MITIPSINGRPAREYAMGILGSALLGALIGLAFWL